MAIGDEQVAVMAAALHERGLPDEQMGTLYKAIDAVYNAMTLVCEMCKSGHVPVPVLRPLFETTKDIGGLREAFREAVGSL
jgi:hypothetical protein